MLTATQATSRKTRMQMFAPQEHRTTVPATEQPFIARVGFVIDPHIQIAELGPNLRKRCFPTGSLRGFCEPPVPRGPVLARKMAHDLMPPTVLEAVTLREADKEVVEPLIRLSQFHHFLGQQPEGQRGILPTDGHMTHAFVTIDALRLMFTAYWRLTGLPGWVIEAHDMEEAFAVRKDSFLLLGPSARHFNDCPIEVPESMAMAA